MLYDLHDEIKHFCRITILWNMEKSTKNLKENGMLVQQPTSRHSVDIQNQCHTGIQEEKGAEKLTRCKKDNYEEQFIHFLILANAVFNFVFSLCFAIYVVANNKQRAYHDL